MPGSLYFFTYGISAAVIRLRRRTSTRSRPSRSATASIRRERTPDAEAAAHVALVHVQRRGAAVKHAAERLAIAMRDFRRAVQLEQVLGGVVDAYCSSGFQGHARMAAGLQVELDDRVRIAER